jgi:hypothetical protein
MAGVGDTWVEEGAREGAARAMGGEVGEGGGATLLPASGPPPVRGGAMEASRGEKCLREVHHRRHLHLAATEASSGASHAGSSAEGARREEGRRERIGEA